MNESFSNNFARDDRHPLTAAMLSLVPGLGQLYVGERRKGILFLEAGALNYVLLWLLFYGAQLSQTMQEFAKQYRFELNGELMGALKEMHLGSPASICLMALIALFIWYAAMDAYDHAFGLKRKKIYGDSIIEMSEATSGSYVGHIALMLTCLLMAALFVHPPRHNIVRSIIEYEFNDSKPEVPKIKPPKHANEIHENHGFKPDQTQTKPEVKQPARLHESNPTPQPAVSKPVSEPVVKPTTQPAPPPVPTPQRPARTIYNPTPAAPAPAAATPAALRPLPLPAPNPTSLSRANTRPMPSITPRTLIAAAPPMPTIGSLAASTVGQLPLPLPTMPSPSGALIPAGLPGAKPLTFASSSFAGNLGGPKVFRSGSGTGPQGAPAPANIATGTHGTGTTSGAPVALAQVKTGPHGNGLSGTGTSSVPAPIKFHVGGPSDGPDGFSVMPTGRPVNGGETGNQERTPPGGGAIADGKKGGPATIKEIDYSHYMAELQRRIKKHWFPPRDSESKRVSVTFKIARDGAMSNLLLQKRSGAALSDNAALNAVQTAAPFPSLPEGSPESVDIEFTFDFNVFHN